MSAGITFEILGFGSTVTRMAKIHHGVYMIRQAATLARHAVSGMVKVFRVTDAAGKFEEGLVIVQQRSQATRRELELLRNAAIDAGLRTQFSPQEAVQGLQELAGMGFKARESISLLQPVLDLAAGSGGQLGLADASTAVAGTLRAFRMETGKAVEVTDKLLRITQMTNFQARDFGTGLSKAAGEAGQFGQTLDDTLILMGLLRNQNLNASVSSTAVRNAIRRLAGDARVRNMVEAQGISIYSKATGKMRPVLDIIADMSDKTRNMTRAQKDLFDAKVFGARGIFAAGAFEGATFTRMLADGTKQVLKGRDAIKAYRAELAKSAGVAKQYREALLNTFEGQKKLLRGIIQTAAVLAGEPLVKVLRPIVELLVNFANVAVATFRRIPAPVKQVLSTILVSVVAFGMFATGVVAAKIIIASFGFAMAAAGVTILSVVASIGLLAAAFAGIIATAVAVYYAFETNFAGVTDLFNSMIKAVKGTWAVMQSWKDGTSTISKDMAKDLQKAGVLDFAIRLGGWFGRLKDMAISFWDTMSKSGNAVMTVLSPLAISVKNLFNALAYAATRVFESIFGPFDKLSGAKGGITGTFGAIFTYIIKGISFVGGVIGNVLDFISGLIYKVFAPGFVVGVFQKVWGVLKQIWGVVEPILATFIQIAINILPAVFTVLSGVWDVFMGVVRVVGAFVVGLLGGLDLLAGGGGILPVIQMIANVFTVVFQVVALIFRGVAFLAGILLKWISPVVFALAATFGAILGIVVAVVKWIAGGMVSALNYVIGKVQAMMKPFAWLFDKIQKLNPFASKTEKIAQQTSKSTALSAPVRTAAAAMFGLPVAPNAPGPNQMQRKVPTMPAIPQGTFDQRLLTATGGTAASTDNTTKEALQKLASSDDEKRQLMRIQATALEQIMAMFKSPTEIAEAMAQAIIAAQTLANTSDYSHRG